MYDLNEIKSIPCEDVARKFGVQLKEKHKRLWGRIRNEKTDSFAITPDKNFWYDFGLGKGGSVIDLVMEIEDISLNEAIKWLAEEYGIDNEKTIGWRPLTDSQYKELGIQPERATMNFKFDLNKHTEEQLERWSNKYGMHVKDLAVKYPEIYNKMIIKTALRQITELKNSYNSVMNIYKNSDCNEITKIFLETTAKLYAEKIDCKVDLLNRAVINSKNKYMSLKVDYKKDIKSIQQQKNIAILKDNNIKKRIVKIYKSLFNYKQIDYFTIEQIKALKEVNQALTKGENKFLPMQEIKETYFKLGESMSKLHKEYNNVLNKIDNMPKNNQEYNQLKDRSELIKNNMIRTKDLFLKCNTVIEGIREADKTLKNEMIKRQNLDDSFELTQ